MFAVEEIKDIAIIGAGLMGSGLALVFATRGYNVFLHDVNDEYLSRAMSGINANLSMLADEGLALREELKTVTGRISATVDIGQAAAGSHFVIEAVPEKLELKQNIFRRLDGLCSPHAILATNTSVISISEIAAKSGRRERIVGAHFWNPPFLIPLVEVVKGRESSDEAVNTTYALMKKAGKHPVKVMKDVPGFIGNRLQHALWREAISIVQNGIADPAGIDEVVKQGFGIRLPVLGPLENADMVGLDLTLSIHSYILKHIESSPDPSPLLKEKVEQGQLGFKRGSGFYSWTDAEIKNSREKLLKYLINYKRRSDT